MLSGYTVGGDLHPAPKIKYIIVGSMLFCKCLDILFMENNEKIVFSVLSSCNLCRCFSDVAMVKTRLMVLTKVYIKSIMVKYKSTGLKGFLIL